MIPKRISRPWIARPWRLRTRSLQRLEATIPQLVGEVYEAAPLAERRQLLSHLMRPLGVLALVAVANGIFARLWFRAEWPDMPLHLDDLNAIQPTDVMALVDRVQLVSIESVDGLSQVLASSPILASSAAATILMTVLIQRARNRRPVDDLA